MILTLPWILDVPTEVPVDPQTASTGVIAGITAGVVVGVPVMIVIVRTILPAVRRGVQQLVGINRAVNTVPAGTPPLTERVDAIAGEVADLRAVKAVDRAESIAAREQDRQALATLAQRVDDLFEILAQRP